jgi:hypothetical protein
VADLPRQAREAVETARQGLLPSIEARYQAQHKARLNALYRIRKVQGKDVRSWPQRLEATWGQTIAAFDAVVAAIETEGSAWFAGEPSTTFEVFVVYCEMDLQKRPVDWSAPENERHVQPLMRKGLLRLGLVS